LFLFLLLGVSQRAVLAVLYCSRTLEGNVFERVPQGTTSSITDGHLSVYFNGWDLVNQFHGVTAVFSEFVL
jgi:hypothetical protein